MQEVRRTGNGLLVCDDESLKGWQLIWSGHKRKREHGVAILFAPHVKIEHHMEHLQARIISANVCVKGMRLALLNVYSPTDCTQSEAAKAAFYCALNKAKLVLDESPKYKMIAMGDWNATISAQSKASGAWDSILGYNNSDRVETNNNGERMLAWCSKHDMKIMNTIFRTKRIHRETWQHAATGKWKRIDYMCTTNWVAKYVRSCRVFTDASLVFDTDHRLLVMNLAFPASSRELRFQLSRSTAMREAEPIPDYRALRDIHEIRQNLTDRLESELAVHDINDINDVNELNEMISSTVKSCAEEVCPKINPLKKKEPWDDDLLQNQMKELYKCKDNKEVRKKQKLIKKRRNQLMNGYYRELANNINNAAEARDVEKEFAMARKYTAIKSSSRLAISNEKLKTHFEGHFSMRELPLPPELADPEQFPYLKDDPVTINEDAPTPAEVKHVLKSFKNNKSAGTDKIKTECLKYNSSNKLVASIVQLLLLIWTLLVIPTTWLHASINCLYKKGARNLAANYRGLSIGANMSRIIAKILTERLKEAYEKHLSEAQFGFRRNRSTTDGIFILNTIKEK